MTLLIVICVASFGWLIRLLRQDRCSLGLPVAYLFSLLLIHVPGALATMFSSNLRFESGITEVGMRFVAVASVCFVIGVWLAHRLIPAMRVHAVVDHKDFSWFCLLAGWTCIYGLSPLYHIPSISAAVEKGAAIWMLGVLFGLRAAFLRSDAKRFAMWLGALLVYPVLMLLLGGFLSYGSAAIIIVCAVLTISTRSYWGTMAGISLFVFLGLSIFVNYFQHRTQIREEVWGGAPLETRISAVADTIRDFEWLNLSNRAQLEAMDERLNQNYFVGLAAERIGHGQVNYLWGRSLFEGLLSLIPRLLWQEKPVFGGSPGIVAEMTGLQLSPTTSFGVGNVMEFHINFGVPGVVIGFLVLGWLIGWLDLNCAIAEHRGNVGNVLLYFLPCVALIHPEGSLVELFGGSAASLVAAYAWRWFWKWRIEPIRKRRSQNDAMRLIALNRAPQFIRELSRH